jgi:hypothetical protein
VSGCIEEGKCWGVIGGVVGWALDKVRYAPTMVVWMGVGCG